MDVHVEQVAVALFDDVAAEPLDGVGEIEIDAEAAGADAAAFVADHLGIAGGDVARHQVAEARITALEVVVALGFGDLVGRAGVALSCGTQMRPSLRSDSDISVSFD